ncbi:hypothetical protein SAMN05444161_0621 [Rhizobiales bacterium GAS191]|nr:hypothetical protein SAMN05444161_0621 [Rhizobiales bacterium GAS191]
MMRSSYGQLVACDDKGLSFSEDDNAPTFLLPLLCGRRCPNAVRADEGRW